MKAANGFSTVDVGGHHVNVVSWSSGGSVGCQLGQLAVDWVSWVSGGVGCCRLGPRTPTTNPKQHLTVA